MLVSITTLYNFDDSVFANLELPATMSTTDRQTVIANILMECAELELLFPDFDMMKDAIGYWSKAANLTWTRMWNAMQLDYDVLDNVNATITERETKNRTGEGTDNQTDIDTVAETMGNTRENQNRAYNNTDFTIREKIVDSGSDQTTRNRTLQDRWTDEVGEVNTRTTTRQGNIGVTSSQQLVTQELELAKNNVIMDIVRDFKNRFCILVY